MRLWIAGLALLCCAGHAAGEGRRVPFWPDAVPEAIRSQVDGLAVLETVRELARRHRVHGSPGFSSAAELVRGKAAAAGLQDARIERFPADGRTRYGHFRSYYGWEPVDAALEEVSPRSRVISRFPELPVALADYSQDAEVRAELVDVGAGTDAKHYAGKQVSGRIALASGALPRVHRLACEERGASGFLSDFPNQRTAWSGDDRDLVRWGHLSPYQLGNRFAFMLSKRQSQELRDRLAAGERIVVAARVKAKMVPSAYEVVSATIPGTDLAGQEVLLTAHLCHQSPGANDNASGSAAILEVARALQAAITRQALPRPRRTIRFLWVPEIAGSQAYLTRHPELKERAVAGIHMDMVGGSLASTRGTFHFSRSAETLPHAVNAIAREWLEHVVRASSRHAETGEDAHAGLVWPSGSREAFLADLRGLEMGSDHQVFEESSYRIPMVYFHDWPDVTIHTHKDLPENLDATKLGRVAYLGAGIAWTLAALPDAEAPRVLALARAEAEERVARARLRGELSGDWPEGVLFLREAIAVGLDTLGSVAALWPTVSGAAREDESRLFRQAPPGVARQRRDARVPVRSPEVVGPLDVYYYDHLAEVLGPDASTETALARRDAGDVLAFEALNLVDGSRSVEEIRDVLSGRYEPVPVSEVAEYMELLARAKVIGWR
jgi:hypothetical protein